eukprot:3994225-Lingulodinium_polyedra.AAC.1
MADLVVLAVHDTRRPWDGVLVATDAEGSNRHDFGGFGVCERTVPGEHAARLGRIAEHWRYGVSEAIAARAMALAPPAAAQASGSGTDTPEPPAAA